MRISFSEDLISRFFNFIFREAYQIFSRYEHLLFLKHFEIHQDLFSLIQKVPFAENLISHIFLIRHENKSF